MRPQYILGSLRVDGTYRNNRADGRGGVFAVNHLGDTGTFNIQVKGWFLCPTCPCAYCVSVCMLSCACAHVVAPPLSFSMPSHKTARTYRDNRAHGRGGVFAMNLLGDTGTFNIQVNSEVCCVHCVRMFSCVWVHAVVCLCAFCRPSSLFLDALAQDGTYGDNRAHGRGGSLL